MSVNYHIDIFKKGFMNCITSVPSNAHSILINIFIFNERFFLDIKELFSR